MLDFIQLETIDKVLKKNGFSWNGMIFKEINFERRLVPATVKDFSGSATVVHCQIKITNWENKANISRNNDSYMVLELFITKAGFKVYVQKDKYSPELSLCADLSEDFVKETLKSYPKEYAPILGELCNKMIQSIQDNADFSKKQVEQKINDLTLQIADIQSRANEDKKVWQNYLDNINQTNQNIEETEK